MDLYGWHFRERTTRRFALWEESSLRVFVADNALGTMSNFVADDETCCKDLAVAGFISIDGSRITLLVKRFGVNLATMSLHCCRFVSVALCCGQSGVNIVK